MKAVGSKYLQYTNYFRQLHHNLQMQQIRKIMSTPHSTDHFMYNFPHYPTQYTWMYGDMGLHAYQWKPAEPAHAKSRALVVNLNALNAHTGLSGRMAEIFAQDGISTVGFDFPNFGKSHSPFPGHIDHIDSLVEISLKFLQDQKQKHPDQPTFLFGLSMGGLIALQLALRNPELVDGCIFVNPAFRDNPLNNGLLKKLMMFGGRFFPKLQTLRPLRSHSTKASLSKYRVNDKLIYSGKVWTSTTWALLSYMRSISRKQHFQQFQTPFLCMQGGSDKVLNPFVVFELEKNSRSQDKEIVIIPEMWHAMWFDDHMPEVIEMAKQWIIARADETEPKRKGQKDNHEQRNMNQLNK